MTDEIFAKIKSQLKFDAQGLIPAIIQDRKTEKVLTLCYMNDIALRTTLEKGFIHLFRRSQNKLMKKGETSGHTQRLVEAWVDCDGDTVLLKVDQTGPACHTGAPTCFFTQAKL